MKDTLLVKEVGRDRRRKKPSTRRNSNPRPQEFCSEVMCSTAVLQPQPILSCLLNIHHQIFESDQFNALFSAWRRCKRVHCPSPPRSWTSSTGSSSRASSSRTTSWPSDRWAARLFVTYSFLAQTWPLLVFDHWVHLPLEQQELPTAIHLIDELDKD